MYICHLLNGCAICSWNRTQYDELEEEEDEQMKRRTMALSSTDAPSSRRQPGQPGDGQSAATAAETGSTASSTAALAVAGAVGAGADASSTASGGGNGGGGSDGGSVPGSARDEPAMISFDEDVAEPLAASSRHVPGELPDIVVPSVLL